MCVWSVVMALLSVLLEVAPCGQLYVGGVLGPMENTTKAHALQRYKAKVYDELFRLGCCVVFFTINVSE